MLRVDLATLASLIWSSATWRMNYDDALRLKPGLPKKLAGAVRLISVSIATGSLWIGGGNRLVFGLVRLSSNWVCRDVSLSSVFSNFAGIALQLVLWLVGTLTL